MSKKLSTLKITANNGNNIGVGVYGNRNTILSDSSVVIYETRSSPFPVGTVLELKRKNISQRIQYLSLIGFQDNILLLNDAKSSTTVEVYLNDGILFCQNDGVPDCVHVDFALALPGVRMRLKH